MAIWLSVTDLHERRYYQAPIRNLKKDDRLCRDFCSLNAKLLGRLQIDPDILKNVKIARNIMVPTAFLEGAFQRLSGQNSIPQVYPPLPAGLTKLKELETYMRQCIDTTGAPTSGKKGIIASIGWTVVPKEGKILNFILQCNRHFNDDPADSIRMTFPLGLQVIEEKVF